MSNDQFQYYGKGLQSPPDRAAAITPSDSTDLAAATRAINVSDPGYVKVTTVGGDTVTLYVAGGVTFPIRALRVWATGTTATEIVGLW